MKLAGVGEAGEGGAGEAAGGGGLNLDVRNPTEIRRPRPDRALSEKKKAEIARER